MSESEKQPGTAIRWAPTVLLALATCVVPLWLWDVPPRWFALKSDDFVYLTRSRTAAAVWGHLIAPHNGHIVPLFILETHLLARLAGSLEAVPTVLSWATYGTLVLAAVLAGHLIAWETGSAARGLVAMAAVGFTSVLGTAILWYSAGQALAAGAMILAMLAALQAWRARGSWWLLVMAALATTAAPLFWTAGYTAGLVGAAYLWFDGRRVCRRVAALPPVVSVITFLVARDVTPRIFATASRVSEKPFRTVIEAGPAVTHSVQGICEALVFNNLGLDAPTTASQAFVIGFAIAGLWLWTRCGLGSNGLPFKPGINPLEAAGAALVAGSFGIVYAVRGTESTYDGLRALGWYNAIPELGAVLFAAGWWSGQIESPPPKAIEPPLRMELLVFLLFAVAMLVLQAPRVDRVIFQYDGLSAKYGSEHSNRTYAELAEAARTQRRALAVLDRLEQTARKRQISRAETRREAERVMVPGMPAGLAGVGAAELLDFSGTTSESVDPDHQENVNTNG